MSNDYLLIIGSALFAMYIVLLIYIVYMIKTLKRMESWLREAEQRDHCQEQSGEGDK